MKLSAVIATCAGRERFLDESVESLRMQGVEPRVICDDRPSWAKWREAIESCETQYLALPHDDDVYMPGFVDETTAWLDAHPDAAAVFTLDYHIDEAGRRVGATPMLLPAKDSYGYRDILEGSLKHGHVLRCETVVLRTSVVKQISYPDRSECGSAHDTQFWFLLLEKGSVGVIPKPLVKYRKWGGSDTQKNIVGNLAQFDGYKALQWASDRHPEFVPWWGWCNLARMKEGMEHAVEEKRLREKAAAATECEFFVCHEPPDNAGTGILVAERVRRRNSDASVRIAYYVHPGDGGSIHVGFANGCPILRCPGTIAGFSALVAKFNPAKIEYHHLLRWEPEILTVGICEKDIYLHDSYLWCLRWHSFDGEKACNEPEPDKCGACAGASSDAVAARWLQMRQLVTDSGARVIANSGYTARYAAFHLGTPVLIHEFAPPPLGERFKGKKVGYFGGFYPVKGVHILLEAARLLPDVQFLLFCALPEGTGAGHRLFGYQNVVCCGPYQRKDLHMLVNLVDIGVVPSINESYGLVARELRSLGLPVVATRAGGLDGTVPPGDAKALAGAIREAL